MFIISPTMAARRICGKFSVTITSGLDLVLSDDTVGTCSGIMIAHVP